MTTVEPRGRIGKNYFIKFKVAKIYLLKVENVLFCTKRTLCDSVITSLVVVVFILSLEFLSTRLNDAFDNCETTLFFVSLNIFNTGMYYTFFIHKLNVYKHT